MNRSIFITRELVEASPLLSYLTENGWKVYDRSLIEIKRIPFKINVDTDWIFLSSSNGARILLESFKPDKNVKIGVVGNATANAVRKLGFDVDFMGDSGDMHDVGTKFVPVLGSKTVLFCGAEDGSEKLRSELPQKQVSFIPIYRTELKSKVDIPETSVVFLTSPSNATAYLNNASLKDKTVIAIGNTTAEFLEGKGVEKVLIPSAPTEEHVVALLRRL